MELKIEFIIAVAIGAILLGVMLPPALDALYDTNPADFTHSHSKSLDSNSKPIATDRNTTADSATQAIFKLLPLFTTLAGMGILMAVGLKQLGYI